MTFGGEGFGIIIIYGFIFVFLIPFLMGFLISYFILKRVFIDKKEKTFIKKKFNRIFVAILISIIIGWLSFVFLGHFFGDIGNNILNVKSGYPIK